MGHIADETLTDKQAAFVVAYCQNGFNATRAAIKAGYPEASAYSVAAENLTKPKIRAAVRVRLASEGITADRIKFALAEIAFEGDVGKVAEFINTKVSLAELQKKGLNTKLIKSISQSTNKYGESRKVEMYSSLDALEKLGRVLAMFTDRA